MSPRCFNVSHNRLMIYHTFHCPVKKWNNKMACIFKNQYNFRMSHLFHCIYTFDCPYIFNKLSLTFEKTLFWLPRNTHTNNDSTSELKALGNVLTNRQLNFELI